MKMPRQNKTGLAKFATIFAIASVLVFGLCTGSVMLSSGGDKSFFVYLASASAAVEAVCIVGLLVVGVMAFIRSIRNY
ncbi:hypothetical protein [Edaphobacter sp.]|uniref:hypothetical protein n=1 Tax=Edaphobacter sp. TaxID=1934404 RepID=UPI002DC030E1|nr:hypothetical protein [Edaphobacter sp.]HEU5339627.1 hypothetical protein [Edaphobacter sp.]